MATRVGVLDGGGPKDSENTLNSFLTKCGENVFWQIGPDMSRLTRSGEKWLEKIWTLNSKFWTLTKTGLELSALR